MEEKRKSQEEQGQQRVKRSKPKRGYRKGGASGRKGLKRATLKRDIRDALKLNRASDESRMNPYRQINPNGKSKIRFTPLGGLGEIGGNIAVLEDDESAIIIDVGMSFPDETMHGVDILVPDFSYLHAIKSKIKGIVITHAHEDHIGAVPYLFKELKFPIYGTPLSLAMIEAKFQEHKLRDDTKYFNYIVKRELYEIGTFKVE